MLWINIDISFMGDERKSVCIEKKWPPITAKIAKTLVRSNPKDLEGIVDIVLPPPFLILLKISGLLFD